MIERPRTNPQVLKLRPSDLRRCAELEQLLFAGDDPWSIMAFFAEIERGNYYLGAYDESKQLLGYAGLGVLGRPPKAEAEVYTIAVDPAHQRKGIGRVLLCGLLDYADHRRATTFLEVRTDNDAAISLYRDHGFEIVGLRRRYYQPSGADAHTMRRPARSTVEEA